jgi:hypothetical protein
MPLRPRAAEMIENTWSTTNWVVPPGTFAKGDNRDDSDDSRYWDLCRARTSSAPVIIYWSLKFYTDLINGTGGITFST